MMKKIISILALAIVTALTAHGAKPPVERVFVSTDREVYIAGDIVWCSLFCFDNHGIPSSLSAVSYLELISSEGTVAEVKIGLLDGRGAGSFRIPVTVPTGVYRLVSYTSCEANEEGAPWMSGSRLLTIFNTLSTARVQDGVSILDEEAYSLLKRSAPEEFGNLVFNSQSRVRKGASFDMLIQNGGPASDFSISIYHEDDIIPAPQDCSMSSFLNSLSSIKDPVIIGNRPLDYDGEIISAHVKGEIAKEDGFSIATLSSAGAPSNLYIGITGNDKVSFMTNNIYGDREIVCEVSSLDKKEGVIEIDSPFIYPKSGTLPKLFLNKGQYGDLTSRKVALRSEASIRQDTIATMLRHREDLLLESSPLQRYHLDDYTRFPSVKEVIVEIIPMLKLQREKGEYHLRLTVSDVTDNYRTRVGNLLVMMDGVVLSDLDNLLDFDAMLIEDVDIYSQAIVCGKVSFSGIVNFVTKKNYVTALTFPANVRVVDFKGVSYPVAYYGTKPEGLEVDRRQVLYWDPAVRIAHGGQHRFQIHAPGYSGKFRVVAEGVASDGTPIHQEWTFEVE